MMEPKLITTVIIWSGMAGFIIVVCAISGILFATRRRMAAVIAKNLAIQTMLEERQKIEVAHLHLQNLFVDAVSSEVEGIQTALQGMAFSRDMDDHLDSAQKGCWELLSIAQRAVECIDACKPIRNDRLTPIDMVSVLSRLSRTWGPSRWSVPILQLTSDLLYHSAHVIASRFELERALSRLIEHMSEVRKPTVINAHLKVLDDRLVVSLACKESEVATPVQAETWIWIASRYLANMGGRLEIDPFGFTLDLPLAPTTDSAGDSGPCATLPSASESVA